MPDVEEDVTVRRQRIEGKELEWNWNEKRFNGDDGIEMMNILQYLSSNKTNKTTTEKGDEEEEENH